MRTLPIVGLRATSSPRISSGVTPASRAKADLEHIGSRCGVGGDERGDVARASRSAGIEPRSFEVVQPGLEETFEGAGIVLGHAEQGTAGFG